MSYKPIWGSPTLKIENLNVSYGKLHVLWDISIEVKNKEIVALIGSNGAGKTTLLKTISGLVKPLSGVIEFNDENVVGRPPYDICRKGIIHVPEGGGLFPRMTVLENLEVGAFLSDSRRVLYESLDRVYKLFPVLKERQQQRVETLSGGERQMLAIARGLMARPKLLMIDEPTMGLAPKVALEVYDAIKELNKDGVTILLVSQEVHKALELADRAYVLEAGRILDSGPCKELVKNTKIKEAYLGV
jgi:branched-chain amino acid transport system ATP-binding protein